MTDTEPFNVIIAGVGGQGNVLASQILAHMLEGFQVTIGETYGASQRGGSVMSHLRISTAQRCSPLIPEGKAHVIVGLEPAESLRVVAPWGNPETRILTNTRPIYPLGVLAGDATYPDLDELLAELRALARDLWTIPATDMALKLGDPILTNIILLGALSALDLLPTPLDRARFEAVITRLLPHATLAVNLEAFDQGAKCFCR